MTDLQQTMYDMMTITPTEWLWMFILVTPAIIYYWLSDNDNFKQGELRYNRSMSKAGKQQVVSNRTRNLQNGSYTDIFRKEAELERKRKANMAFQMSRSGGRSRW